MSVKIKLSRVGARKQPSYRVVVIDSRKKINGRYIEKLGHYDPKPDKFKFEIDKDRAMYWLEQGAIPSPTVKSLLKKDGILKDFHNKKFGIEEPSEQESEEDLASEDEE
ncbi:MAG: 30S ribosomal protein S16 [Candidatus Cloacimonetes bacterium]|nr:30S ribosomal protein S16 [Candidatus Cloacimonadota bacterium]MBS3767932.1 30S ribosomal protein S16 [Candidatus Cloacimonadota bacterium]